LQCAVRDCDRIVDYYCDPSSGLTKRKLRLRLYNFGLAVPVRDGLRETRWANWQAALSATA
jgi:hypothetical protein